MSTTQFQRGNLTTYFPSGMAWPAVDGRRGRYITCPFKVDIHMGLAVVNDFGDLVPVPCIVSDYILSPMVPGSVS